MTVDAYSLCPCGSGKKIKFCCGTEVVSVLEKAAGALESGQRMAALEHIKGALSKTPNIASLVSFQAQIEMQLNEWPAAKKTAGDYLKSFPDSPDALAVNACIVAVAEGNSDAAIDLLQTALDKSENELAPSVVQAFGVIGELLVSQNRVPAALGHLGVQVELTGESESRAGQVLQSLHDSQGVPVLLKDFSIDVPVADDAAWKSEYQEAVLTAMNRCCWRSAAQQLEKLLKTHPGEPSLLIPLARLYGLLDKNTEHCQTLRKAISSGKLSEDDAVEMEARALLLDTETEAATVDRVLLTYTVKDVDALTERLSESERVTAAVVDPKQFPAEDGPPPRGIYLLLDKPALGPDDEVTADNIPTIIGDVLVFGKQTDREARAELLVIKSDDFWLKTTAAAEVFGELAGPSADEEVVGKIPAETAELVWRWHFAPGTAKSVVDKLTAEKRKQVCLEKWPNVQLPAFDNKKASEVSDDPAYRIRLLAAIKNLELQAETSLWDIDFDQLRTQLGLPNQAAISSEGLDMRTLPVVRLSRVDVKSLSDDDLVLGFRRAASFRLMSAAEKFGQEVIERPACHGSIPPYVVNMVLGSLAGESDKAVEYTLKAQEACGDQSNAPLGQLLVSELNLRFMRQEIKDVERLMQRLQTEYRDDQQVSQLLFQTLVRFGLLTPEGMPTQMPPQAPAGGEPAGGGAPASAGDGGLWTPDGPPPASDQAGGEEKSKLWVPGMD